MNAKSSSLFAVFQFDYTLFTSFGCSFRSFRISLHLGVLIDPNFRTFTCNRLSDGEFGTRSFVLLFCINCWPNDGDENARETIAERAFSNGKFNVISPCCVLPRYDCVSFVFSWFDFLWVDLFVWSLFRVVYAIMRCLCKEMSFAVSSFNFTFAFCAHLFSELRCVISAFFYSSYIRRTQASTIFIDFPPDLACVTYINSNRVRHFTFKNELGLICYSFFA
jgi:hypothetical protein